MPLGSKESTGHDSIHGIGNTKNSIFREIVGSKEIPIFPDSIRLLAKLRARNVDIGLSSSSKNARFVLEKSKLVGYFKEIMDGLVAEREHIASKPHPAFYHHASLIMKRRPEECIVIEDAISGVVSANQAGIG